MNKRRNFLPKSKTGPLTREPIDKTSFGYTLWLILGSKEAKIRKAAKRLSVARQFLSDIIHGRRQISQQALRDKQWRETFAVHYTDGWNRHHNTFELRVHNQSLNQKCRNSNGASDDWKDAVGEFVKRVLANRGDEFKDIIPKVSVVCLRKEETWQRVTTGEKTLVTSIFRDALKEICKLYQLNANRPSSLYAEAHTLIKQLG
jgi:hypothetical protein